MTIDITKSAVDYPGTGAQFDFDIANDGEGIYYEETTEIDVELIEDGVATPQIEGTDYTVSASYTSSGYVTMITAPTNVQTLRLERNTPLTQALGLSNAGAYNPSDVGSALDKLTRITQDLSRAVNDNEGEADDDHAMTLDPSGDAWDGESKIIENVANGVASTDAATVSQVTDAIAISGLALIGQSTTSLAIGTGNQSFTLAAASITSFTPTQYLIAQDNGDAANYMIGRLVSYDSGTGALVINVTDTGGSGTIADWSVSASAFPQPVEMVDDTTPQLGGPLDSNSHEVRWSKGADVASASSLTLGADGNYFDITGTTTITAIATKGIGTVVKLHFDAALQLTHSADLVLPGSANLAIAAGDEAEFVEYASGDWRLTNYQSAAGITKPDDVVRLSTDSTLNGAGVATTVVDDGTQSSGTYTPTYVGGNFRKIVNGGAFTLAAPTAAGDYDLRILVTNNASAGVITFTGFDFEDGDSLTTTDGEDFIIYISKIDTFEVSTIKALQ